VGDPWESIDAKAFGIETLLEWYSADPREMPYPPDYPKMPGEPPRVQPSKINPANWATSSAANDVCVLSPMGT
jgi:hypothetical protein